MTTDEERKRAYKAFKKRLKLTRLDDASGLSRGGSKQSGVAGITPPTGFSRRRLGGACGRREAETSGRRDLFTRSGSVTLDPSPTARGASVDAVAAARDAAPALVDDTAARAAGRLRTVLGLAMLAMLGLSWPLWVEPTAFPRVPFAPGLAGTPTTLSWTVFAALLGSVAAATAGLAWKTALGLSLAVLTLLVLQDQERFQAWTYQFAMVALLLAALSARAGARIGPVVVHRDLCVLGAIEARRVVLPRAGGTIPGDGGPPPGVGPIGLAGRRAVRVGPVDAGLGGRVGPGTGRARDPSHGTRRGRHPARRAHHDPRALGHGA